MAKFVPAAVRALGAYDPDQASDEAGLSCKDPSRTRQADAKDADINNIVRNFGITGAVPQGVRIPTFGDFDVVTDYASAIQAVRAAEASFLAMPADVRTRFGNDPQAFVEFCSDPSNLPEMRKLGLAVPEASVAVPEPPPAA